MIWRRKLEAQIHALRADMEQQVARRARPRGAFRHESPGKGCSSAGRGWPNSRSHASEPNPMTHDRLLAGRETQPRAPTRPDRRTERPHGGAVSEPGLMVTTRKIAARVRRGGHGLRGDRRSVDLTRHDHRILLCGRNASMPYADAPRNRTPTTIRIRIFQSLARKRKITPPSPSSASESSASPRRRRRRSRRGGCRGRRGSTGVSFM